MPKPLGWRRHDHSANQSRARNIVRQSTRSGNLRRKRLVGIDSNRAFSSRSNSETGRYSLATCSHMGSMVSFLCANRRPKIAQGFLGEAPGRQTATEGVVRGSVAFYVGSPEGHQSQVSGGKFSCGKQGGVQYQGEQVPLDRSCPLRSGSCVCPLYRDTFGVRQGQCGDRLTEETRWS